MSDSLVELWTQVARKLLPADATARQMQTAQNAYLAGAMGVFLLLERAAAADDAQVLAAAFKGLRRELNLGRTPAPGRRRRKRQAKGAHV